jgi:hypothetical protein
MNSRLGLAAPIQNGCQEQGVCFMILQQKEHGKLGQQSFVIALTQPQNLPDISKLTAVPKDLILGAMWGLSKAGVVTVGDIVVGYLLVVGQHWSESGKGICHSRPGSHQ